MLAKKQTHTKPLFKQLSILPFNEINSYLILSFVHKFYYHNYLLPEILQNYFTRLTALHNHNTRQVNYDLFRSHYSSRMSFYTLKIKGSKLWNSIPNNLKCIFSKSLFKKKLRDFLIQNI